MEQTSYSPEPLLVPANADSDLPRISVTPPREEQCIYRTYSQDTQTEILPQLDERIVKQSEVLLNQTDKYGQNIQQVTSKYIKKADSGLRYRRIPAQFTIESIVFAINASELTFCTICLMFIYFFKDYVSSYISALFYIPVIAAGLYFLSFLLVWRMKRNIKDRSGVFLLVLIFMICEAVILCWLAPVYTEFFMLAEVSIVCLSMYALIGHAMVLRRSYSAVTGRLVAVLFSVIGFVGYLVLFRIDQRTTIYMAITTSLICVYLWAFTNKIDILKEDLSIDDTLRAAIFIALEMYEAKVKWIFKILFFWVIIFKKRRVDDLIEPHSV